ncbi:MAG: caspase family protein [Saprospiraceae bacterium]|nr:caspase family protein [Saprospiraceae bacterium]
MGRTPEGEGRSSVPKGKNHLLVIGIDRYSGGINPLNNAVRDAERFADLLFEHYQFEKTYSRLLMDADAGRSNIVKAFEDLLGKVGKEDNLVFYFSGHGEYLENRKEGFWIPFDARLNDSSTYLTNSEVVGFIRSIKARHVLGIVDSCFAGTLFARSMGTAARRLYAIPSRWLLTAGRNEPVLDGSLGDHSPFAKSLFAQLEHNQRAALGISRLWNDMREGVTANAQQTPRCEPLQGANHLGGEFFFLRKGEAPPPEIMKGGESDLMYTDTAGNEYQLRIAELERAGRKRLAELLIEKIQRIQEALILEDDPTRIMRYEKQIAEADKQLKDLKHNL